MMIAGDVTWDNWGARYEHLIDDDIATFMCSDNNTAPGASFTLDLGKKAKLSRFKIYQRQESTSWFYTHGNFQIFEVYSSDEEGDSPSGDWSAWTLQKVCTEIKPSGAPLGQVTSEDIEEMRRGHDFSLPLDMPPVRYLRFKVLKVWNNSAHTFSEVAELTTYGQYVD
jgi:hypothetical protein